MSSAGVHHEGRCSIVGAWPRPDSLNDAISFGDKVHRSMKRMEVAARSDLLTFPAQDTLCPSRLFLADNVEAASAVSTATPPAVEATTTPTDPPTIQPLRRVRRQNGFELPSISDT